VTTVNPVFVDNMDNKVNDSDAGWPTRVYFIHALDQTARRNPFRREMIVATITVGLWAHYLLLFPVDCEPPFFADC